MGGLLGGGPKGYVAPLFKIIWGGGGSPPSSYVYVGAGVLYLSLLQLQVFRSILKYQKK